MKNDTQPRETRWNDAPARRGRYAAICGVALAVGCLGGDPVPNEEPSEGAGRLTPDSDLESLESAASRAGSLAPGEDAFVRDALAMLSEGRRTFRYDSFGDEVFWGGTLRLHDALQGAALGGVGDGVSPELALSVGLKVDSAALPRSLVHKLRAGQVDLQDPATTLALLRLDAVVGVEGTFDAQGQRLTSVGIRCAFCHSTVDDSLAPGIGKRLDGWPNRDLNVGAIIGLAPNLTPVAELLGVPEATLRTVLASWGPGKYDATLFLDGKALKPDGEPAAVLIPAAFGLAGVNLATYTGWGNVTHWNALVANLELHGQGTFYDPRLDDPVRFPIAARHRLGHTRHDPDLVTSKLAALQLYQLALRAPSPDPSRYDASAAARGRALFGGKARCASCHVPPLYTEPGWNMHTAEEIGIDAFQAERSPDRRYRTTPLRGLFTRSKGGFYHDGRFATLGAVVDHYDRAHALSLRASEKADLVAFLQSL